MNTENKQNVILSLDAETDGLWGKAFAIAAIAYDENANEVARFVARSSEKVENKWVKENVLPQCSRIAVVGNYLQLLSAFANFYNSMKERYNITALYHMGHVVEAYLFRELVSNKLIGEWDAPFVPIEVSAYLEMSGERPDSVDTYVQKHDVKLNIEGLSTHNPLYDCEVAYRVFNHIKTNI